MPNNDAIDKSTRAKASSAHSRINIPLDLNSWRDVPEDQQQVLLWFHQHLLDENITWEQTDTLLVKKNGGHYNRNTIFKVLKGMHEASLDNFIEAVCSYRDTVKKRAGVKHATFIENDVSKIMFAAFDYAFANNRMQLVIGAAGMGKTTALKEWAHRNNSGRSVYVDCPPFGGNKGFLRAIARKVGVSQNLATPDMLAAVVRAFSPNRILLLDNMHRVVPSDPRSKAVAFDLLQYIFENSGCAIGITATSRIESIMQTTGYIYDQFGGRVGDPIYLHERVQDKAFIPIVEQFLPNPSDQLINALRPIANGAGRLHKLSEHLELAARIAKKKKERLTERHILMAIKTRTDLSKKRK